MRRTAILWSLALCALSGCVSYGGRYPMNWPDRVVEQSGQCQVVDGDFQDTGEKFEEVADLQYVQEPARLARLLGTWGDQDGLPDENTANLSDTDPYRAVRLRLIDQRLEVTAYPAEGESRSFQLPVEPECDETLVELAADWNADSFVVISALDRASLKLGRASDGSLIVKANSAGSMFFLYAPMFWGKDQTWFRFRPAPVPVDEAESTVGD